eukprot:CAMPEP_0181292840 /NCGR_PEP_ID=MMETSP1101-20121128/2734_1 /TAXON_ID=46948 /ORGANISM="Rhodomonas abbreviata, Strain Caron Lab Isolate" /LENGTH=262 /DNA_ID=CAMNT_0023397363 /DNA_START=20 /DNA_END=808 /DNA_ORIENTATION=-
MKGETRAVVDNYTEQTPLKGFSSSELKRPNNWKEAEAQGWPAPSYDSEEQQRLIQKGFLRKVYGILSLQLATTVGICWAVMAHPAVNSFFLANGWILISCFILSLGLVVGLQMKKNEHPLNLLLLAAFTLVESCLVASVCAHYEAHGVGQLVAVAWGVTLVIFACLTLFVVVTPWDFSILGMFLPVALIAMIMYSVVCLIIGIQTGATFAFLGALLFSAFIVYDTHMIMTRMGCDEYIVACVELYLDIINLFLMILQLLGSD